MMTAAGVIDAFVFMPRPMLDKGAVTDYMTRRMQAARDSESKEMLFGMLDEIESGRFDVRRNL